jgi:hypothetical protein
MRREQAFSSFSLLEPLSFFVGVRIFKDLLACETNTTLLQNERNSLTHYHMPLSYLEYVKGPMYTKM